jgi:hypothetical protein
MRASVVSRPNRLLPHHPEFERTILGVSMLVPDRGKEATLVLHEHDFYDLRHRVIWSAIELLTATSQAIDSLTVGDALEASGDMEKAGGPAYLASLTDGVPTAIAIEVYITRVKEAAALRRLIQLTHETSESAWEHNANPAEIINTIQAAAVDVARTLEIRPPRRDFQLVAEDHYLLDFPDLRISFEIDRLRRERQELVGELSVFCTLPGVKTFDGALSVADFNLSSARARVERAKLLAERSEAKLDWLGYVEEFCQRVLVAERTGAPAVDLRDLARPAADDAIRVEGIVLPRRHPAILFGDGGAAKSYSGLYLACRLAQQGHVVALFDWELAGEDHRDRLERLFGHSMPKIYYVRCDRPLVHEADRLRRIVRQEEIDYAVYDSVAFACDGPPESAETASCYFRAVRQIGVGSLHIAHITKGENSDKPFGSVFWHNGARCTYFVKLADGIPGDERLHVGFYNRKANLGGLNAAVGFEITFTATSTTFTKANPAENPELAAKMPIAQRMAHLLKRGSMRPERIAKELDAKLDTVTRTMRRHKTMFTLVDGGEVALLQRVK